MYILINIDLYQKGAESLRIQIKYGLKYIKITHDICDRAYS